MRPLISLLLLALLGGCSIVYKLPTRQGNVIEQEQLDKLATGMTRNQVRFLLGTPIASSPLRDDVWDYTGYYKNPRGKVFSRTVMLYFEGDKLARMEGIQVANSEALENPDLEALEKEAKKEKKEADRAKEERDSGIVIQPK